MRPYWTVFSSQDELLVLAVPSGKDSWTSQKELILPATPANLQKAQTFLNADLKNRISRYMRHHGRPYHNNRVVVFVGTAREPVPHLQEPIVCKVQPSSPINFDVEQVLHGEWTDKKITVHFGACFNLPDPPIRVGQRRSFLQLCSIAIAGLWRSATRCLRQNSWRK